MRGSRNNARRMPPEPERTLEDLASLDPDASGPTDVMIAAPRLDIQPSSIAPLALDVSPPVTPPGGIPRRRHSLESVNILTISRKPSRIGYVAAGIAGVAALAGAVAVVVLLRSEPTVATIAAQPRIARAVDHRAPRAVEIARPPLAKHRHFR
jgi:hypothetical protein